MQEELKPAACPFCGGSGIPMHFDDCYFSVALKFKRAAPADLSLLPDLLEAWNRRTPVSGEVAEGADAFQFALMEHLGPAALAGGKMTPYKAFELGWQARGQQAGGAEE